MMLYYIYITKYHKIIQNTNIFSRIPKRAVDINSQKSLEISRAATHVA